MKILAKRTKGFYSKNLLTQFTIVFGGFKLHLNQKLRLTFFIILISGGSLYGQIPEICGNLIDDDLDGFIDECPFNCDDQFYLSSLDYLLTIDKDTWPQFIISFVSQSPGHTIGYNPKDNFIYKLTNDPTPRVLMIGSDGNYFDLGPIIGGLPGLSTGPFDGGDFDNAGFFYVSQSQGTKNIAKIDISTGTPRLVSHAGLGGGSFKDIAFHPTTGKLYGFDVDGKILATIHPTRGHLLTQNTLNLESVGALFFDPFGNLYGYGTTPGAPAGTVNSTLIKFNLPNGVVEVGPGAAFFSPLDGCSCSQRIGFRKSYSGPRISPNQTFTVRYEIANTTGYPIHNTTFSETLTNGMVWRSEPKNLSPRFMIGPTSIGSSSSANFTITQIPKGISSFEIDVFVSAQYNGGSPHKSQAKLNDLPPIYGQFIVSDDTSSLAFNDSTIIDFNPEICSDGIDNDGDGLIDQNDDDCPLRNFEQLLASEDELQVFNLVTANNDGYNDAFYIRNISKHQATVQIFNSLGQLLYKSSNYQNDWNGNENGQKQPSGIYYYTISHSQSDRKVQSGYFHLISF